MRLKSLIENVNHLEVADVEIEFIPGIPQIHFLGLPDRLIKESFYRIKSALKNSGYKFPLSSQMIVNIKPSHLRKSSRGVELAVALGLLLKTDQVEKDKIDPNWVIYGELGLDGNIYEPSDLAPNLGGLKNLEILTGKGEGASCYRLENLKEFEIYFSQKNKKMERPKDGLEKKYTTEEADFLFLAATSGLHSLLAGDSGAGKSTLARALNSFLPEPEEGEQIREYNDWRPVVAPHQSITPGAFLGGGANLYEGEVERAQGGILLLDELLEFDSEILEALRGPMTGEKMRLSRGPNHREISAEFQVVATTNLCPCGKWTPTKTPPSCRFSRTKCSRYIERFSGPVLDRFGLLLYTNYKAKRTVPGTDILKRVELCREKQKQVTEAEDMPALLETYYAQLSTRRKNYLRLVARIFSLDAQESSAKVRIEDYNQAERWVIKPFEQLEKGMS